MQKFKQELLIPTIYRIIETTISNNRETIDANILLDFILESAMDRFILFKFVEFHRLNNDKIDEFIKFIDEQEESTKRIYFEYIPFDFIFFKEMKHKYDELLTENQQNQTELNQTKDELKQKENELNQKENELNQTKNELNQKENELNKTKDELKQTKDELNQTKDELNQKKNELNQTKDELNQKENELKQFKNKYFISKVDIKQYSHLMMVGGFDNLNQLGEKPNKKYGSSSVIYPSLKSSIDPSLLLSFSVYCHHSVQITRNGSLLGIGNNKNGQICSSLPKEEIIQFTEFTIKDIRDRQLDPISVCCYFHGTLYMFSSDSSRQLVLCDKDINCGKPVFLDIDNEHPVSLFGGRSHLAAITNKGAIIFINRDAVKKSPESCIVSNSLPENEKAVGIACCANSVIALSLNGRLFASAIECESNVLKFSLVSELEDKKIIWVSGVHDHFLAVSSEGRVFGCGSNRCGQLGLGQKTEEVSSFVEISLLNENEIIAAYAGDWFSLFETREGKILACGYDYHKELLLSRESREDVYSPTETNITESGSFCIAGCGLSAVFIGGDPPPNTPNRLINIFELHNYF